MTGRGEPDRDAGAVVPPGAANVGAHRPSQASPAVPTRPSAASSAGGTSTAIGGPSGTDTTRCHAGPWRRHTSARRALKPRRTASASWSNSSSIGTPRLTRSPNPASTVSGERGPRRAARSTAASRDRRRGPKATAATAAATIDGHHTQSPPGGRPAEEQHDDLGQGDGGGQRHDGGDGDEQPPTGPRRHGAPDGLGASTRPSRIGTTRSAAAATDASWVTTRIVWPSAVQQREQLEDLGDPGRVERTGRLVGEQQGRLVGQGAGDGEALALTARQRRRW